MSWKVNAPVLDLVPISGPCCRIIPSFFYKIETWLEKLLPLPITTISLIPLKQKQTSILRMLHQQSCDQPPKSYLKLHHKTSPNPAKMTQCAKQLRSEKSEITFNLIHQRRWPYPLGEQVRPDDKPSGINPPPAPLH